MTEFLTPDPITVEIRNAAGTVHVDLTDVKTTTVDITSTTSHPFGFLDDVFRAVGAGRFGGERRGRRRPAPPDPGQPGSPDLAGADPTAFDLDDQPDAAPWGETDDPPNRVQDDPNWQERDPVERVRVEHTEARDGRRGTVIIDTDPARGGWRTAFAVRVTAPAGSGVRVQSQSADVKLTGEAERAEVRTASGDVAVDRVADRSVIQTASGDVTVNSAAACDIRTASGDVGIVETASQAVLHSTSGDLRMDRPSGNTSARAVSGDIRIIDAGPGSLETVTVSGNVEIGIHPGTIAAVDLSTISGETESEMPVEGEAPPEGSQLTVKATTTSGTIRLRRAVIV